MAAAATAIKMVFTHPYSSPLGELLLASDGESLTGLWFQGQAHFPADLKAQPKALPVFADAQRWLDCYFHGQEPDFLPPLRLEGTAFQKEVWALLLTIPYGETLTYSQLAAKLGRPMSAQAVGGGVGRNPISILVPCHRVVGANGKLTGYAGGLDRKIALLTLEGVDMGQFSLPK